MMHFCTNHDDFQPNFNEFYKSIGGSLPVFGCVEREANMRIILPWLWSSIKTWRKIPYGSSSMSGDEPKTLERSCLRGPLCCLLGREEPKQNDKNVTFLLGRCDFSNNSSITHENLTNGQQSKPFKVNFFSRKINGLPIFNSQGLMSSNRWARDWAGQYHMRSEIWGFLTSFRHSHFCA